MLWTVIVLSASLVITNWVPSAENSIPSVSGPPVISRTFSPLTKSTTAIVAGIFSSSSSSSSSDDPGLGGGPPTALGSDDI
jgi:hypothetical protein